MSAFLAGAASVLTLAPTDMFWVMFATFPVLVWLIDGTAGDPGRGLYARLKPAFITGWWFGFGYFLGGIWWIGAALLVEADNFAWMVPFAVLGLPAFLAIFWGVAIAIARIFWSDDWRRIFVMAITLSVAEYLRGTLMTGFPWNLIGYAAMPNPVMMQSAAVLGVYGVTPLAIAIFSALAILAPGSRNTKRQNIVVLLFCATLIAAHLGFGYWRLQENPPQFVDNVKLRIVQPLIAQEDKWKPEKEAEIFNTFISLSRTDGQAITHYIWPESAFPFILTQRRDALAAIGEMLPEGASLITGAMRAEAGIENGEAPRVFNSVYVINDKGEIIGAADKSHLVPFGEYLPFEKLAKTLGLEEITGIEGGFTPGNSRTILSVPDAGKVLPLVCFEIIFPGKILPERGLSERDDHTLDVAHRPKERVARAMSQSPGWIVNVTNDAWFGATPGPYQHHRQAVIRGVETGLGVVRAANSGISSISDGYGRIHAILPLGIRGKIDGKLPKPAPRTLYQIYGNAGFLFILFVFSILAYRRTSN